MKIDILYNYPEHKETVAKYIMNAFVDEKDRNQEKMEILKAFFGSKHESLFPKTFIAIEDNKCMGTISIFENDLKGQDNLKPWLASLYVEPKFRSRGIAYELMRKVMDTVKEMGYDILYLRTENAGNYYIEHGWEFVYSTVDEKGQDTEIYKKHLNH